MSLSLQVNAIQPLQRIRRQDRSVRWRSRSAQLLGLGCMIGVLIAMDGFGQSIELNLLDENTATLQEIGCCIERVERSLVVTGASEGYDALIDVLLAESVSKSLSTGPTALQFEMKTSLAVGDEEYMVYWCTADDRNWQRFERVPLRADGRWHEYRLPLSPHEPLLGLRFTFGKNPQGIELRNLRVVPPPAMLPADLQAERDSLPTVAEVARDGITLRADCRAHAYTVTDSRTGRIWQSEAISRWLSLYRVENEEQHRLQLFMYDHFAQQPVRAEIEVQPGGTVGFAIYPTTPSDSMVGARYYPPRFHTDMAKGQLVFCDRSSGVLLDQHDTTYAHWPLRVYGSTHCLDMPWIGLFDDSQGDGMMLLLETPADAEVALVPHADGRHWPEVQWLPSMDAFRYPRKSAIAFTTTGRHVALAHLYRDYVKSHGRLKTLADKAIEKPAVQRLRGAPSLWGGRFPTRFIREMRPLGVCNGIVSQCNDPDVVRWLNDQQYLTGRYDSYTDIRDGNTGFQTDDVEQTAIHERPGGPSKRGWTLSSGEYFYWRSSECWEDAASAYVDQELAQRPYNARFIDVAAAATLFEDYHPQHTFDRRQDMANRRALFERMNRYGLVLGTEHGNDWTVDLVEYLEGSMSGPFWWSSWPAGYLKRPTREQLTENYRRFGMGFANRVPLWELVYHDCVVSTWYWGDSAGMLYQAAPELSDRKDLFNILYGTTPLLWIDNTGYQLPDDLHRFLRTYHDTCHLHEQVAFERMTSHEFLSDDRAVQRTRFSNGIVAVVNFSDEPRPYEDLQQSVELAGRGFLVEGPNFTQSRLWIDNEPRTVHSYPGCLVVESGGSGQVAGVRADGRVTMFKTDENRWNVVVDANGACELDICRTTGWPKGEDMAVHHMDDVGEIGSRIARADKDGVVTFTATEDAWRFVLVHTRKDPHVATAEVDDHSTDTSG